MSLLEDLQSLDLSAITDARASVTVALDAPALQRLLTDGGVVSVLGPVGEALDALQSDLSNPQALLQPLLDAVLALADGLGVDDAIVAALVEHVGQGAQILKSVLEGLGGDPAAFAIGGGSAGAAFQTASRALGDYATRSVDGLGRTRALLDLADKGIPRDPTQLVDVGLELLLPFPRQALAATKDQVRALTDGVTAIRLPTERTQGLTAALQRVAATARAGNTAALQLELAGLDALYRQTVSQIATDLRIVQGRIDGLQLGTALTTIVETSRVLKTPDLGAIELLDGLRAKLAEARGFIAQIDAVAARPLADELLDYVEAEFVRAIEGGIDQQVARLEAWLRGLLRELPLQRLRDQLSAAFAAVADAIEQADIDSVATTVRQAITRLDDLLASVDPQAVLDQAAQTSAHAVRQALDAIEAALATITAAINGIAAQAQPILEQAVAGLASFREAFDSVTVLIEAVDLEAATQAVADALANLREKAERLLGVAPLPDDLRPVIEQLIQQVEAVNLDAVLRQPFDQAVAALRIPPDVADTVTGGLDQVADKVENLIPARIGEDLQRELDALFGRLSDLDLGALTRGIGAALDDIVAAIDRVDPVALAQPAADAFDQALACFDRLKPSQLLRPAIDAYDSLLGQLPLPDAQTMAARGAEVVATAGEAAGRVATSPVRALATAPGGREPAAARPGSDRTANAAPETVRPGDLIRALGFVPAKLREALAAIDPAGAGQALRGMNALCGTLAAELRAVHDALFGIEARVLDDLDVMVASLGAARAEAQIALAGDAASLQILAGTGDLRGALAADLSQIRARVHAILNGLGQGGDALTTVAARLEECRLARIGEDLDALLAALDPEPLAAEFEGVLVAAFDAVGGILPQVSADLSHYEQRIRGLIDRFNPGAQAQKLLGVLLVLKEQLDLLSPRRLTDELDEIHAVLRQSLAAYHPAISARDIEGLLNTAKATLTGLDPASLTPDLTPVQAQIDRVPGLLPIDALRGVGAELEAVGSELRALDVAGLVDAVNALVPKVEEAVLRAIETVKQEILALLNAIRFASSGGSASASVGVGVGG